MPSYLPEHAPAATLNRLGHGRAVRDLERTGTPFLLYDAELQDDDPVIVHFPFAWDADSPKVAAMCTSGLMRSVQPCGRPWHFQRFELVAAFHGEGLAEPLLQKFAALARQARRWLETPGNPGLGFGDVIEHFPLLEGRPSALLVPPTPELLMAGLRPAAGARLTSSRDWIHLDALLADPSFGYVQAVPLCASEATHVAETGDGLSFLLQHLLASDAERAAGHDAWFRLLQVEREATALQGSSQTSV